MTSLLDRPTGAPLDVRPAPTAAAVAAAAQAAAASLVAVLAPVVLAWVVDSEAAAPGCRPSGSRSPCGCSRSTAGSPSTAATSAWCPLGLSLAPAWPPAGSAAAGWPGCSTPGPRPSRPAPPAQSPRGRRRRARRLPRRLLPGVAAAALAADMPSITPSACRPCSARAVVSSVGGTLGAAALPAPGRGGRASSGSVQALPAPAGALVPALRRPRSRCSSAARPSCSPRCSALGHARVVELHHALQPGAAGGAVLTLAQALLVPNLVLWTAAALAGPGFGVGAGSLDHPVVLEPRRPARPAGARRAPGARPRSRVAALALLGVPVVAGVVAGALLARSQGSAASPAPSGRRTSPASRCSRGAAHGRARAGCPAAPPGPGLLADTGPPPC